MILNSPKQMFKVSGYVTLLYIHSCFMLFCIACMTFISFPFEYFFLHSVLHVFIKIEKRAEQDQAVPPKVPPPPHSPQPQLIPHFYNIYEPVVVRVDNHLVNGAPAPPVRKHPITIGGYKLPRQRSSLSAAEQLGVTSPSPIKSNGGIACLLGEI